MGTAAASGFALGDLPVDGEAIAVSRTLVRGTKDEKGSAVVGVAALTVRALPDSATATVADFPQLILSQLPFLRRIACRWHQRAADRDDLVQDTLVRALANAQLWQHGTNLRAWLVTIMRNQFLASLAKSGRAADAQRIYADLQSQISLGDGTARLMLRDVDRSLHRMPNAQRQAVLLVGLEGKSYEEVAQAMGISADAVRCHLARARQYLRESVQSGRSASPVGSRSTGLPRLASVK